MTLLRGNIWSTGRKQVRAINRLGDLAQYSPRPLRLPRRYLADRLPDDLPSFSIVTPSLNQARFIDATLRSVLDQDYARLEYFVQDGGSKDATIELLDRYAGRLTGWASQPDANQAQALNRGFARSDGEIMAYLNSDDVLLPGSLAAIAGYLRSHPEVDAVYGHRVLIDEDGREIGRHVIPRHRDWVLSWADFVPQETLFWRRTAWEAAGGCFDESFQSAMDWEFLVRLRDSGAKLVRLPRFLGAFRVHEAQKTQSQVGTGLAEMARIRERIHGRPVSNQEAIYRVRPYILEHVALDALYRAGVLRY